VVPKAHELSRRIAAELEQLLGAVEDVEESFGEVDVGGNGSHGAMYDDAMIQRLPPVRSQWEGLPLSDEKGRREFRQTLKKTTGAIDREWSRLLKLRPDEQSDLRADFDHLESEVGVWRDKVAQHADDPHALDELLDGQANALQLRIQQVYRRALEERRRAAARASSTRRTRRKERVRALRSSIRERVRRRPRPPVGGASDEANLIVSLGEGRATLVTDEPRYTQGMTHLQTGQWQEALHCFEELANAYPDNELIRRGLDEAHFKANVDATIHVRAKYLVIPWARVLLYLSIIIATGLIAVIATYAFKNQVSPALADMRMKREIERQREECQVLIEAGDLDAAEACCQTLLALTPEDPEAKRGLETISEQRKIEQLYEEALALEAQGDNSAANDWAQARSYYESALEEYTEILMRSPQYRDVALHITAIKQTLKLGLLFDDAEADREAGRVAQALEEYQQVRELNSRYHRDLVDSRLFEIYMQLGREIIERNPPAPEMMPSARDYFEEALKLQPRSAEAVLERRLASLFVEGQTRYYQGYPDEAISWLRQVYDERPDYLSGVVVDMLYDAYVRSGDGRQSAGDIGLAYEQYRKAASLEVGDKTLALARLEAIIPYLTPTPTPTVTPTCTSTPLPTPTLKPTPIPTPKPLAACHGYIAFYSDNEAKRGIWLMNPAGENRRYLGESASLRKQYDALVEEQRYSPDHRYYLFVQQAGKSAQIFVLLPKHEQYGDLPPEQITKLTGLSYDPVWSPDGGRVAFVSQENESDDIWVINADGSKPRNLTRNLWEWDKYPSWSPDSRRIVFWSNREFRKQIYVMDADGGNVRNISNTEWDEYDPVWIK